MKSDEMFEPDMMIDEEELQYREDCAERSRDMQDYVREYNRGN